MIEIIRSFINNPKIIWKDSMLKKLLLLISVVLLIASCNRPNDIELASRDGLFYVKNNTKPFIPHPLPCR